MTLNKKKRQGLYLMIGGIGIAVLGLVFSGSKSERIENQPADLEIGKYKFTLERLETEEERIEGLGGRTSLSADRGLLFVFDKPDKYGIWMKDMHFPISIIWLDEECKVTGFRDVASPESYPEVFYPELPSKYVIETNPIPVDVAKGTHNLRNIGAKLNCGFLPK